MGDHIDKTRNERTDFTKGNLDQVKHPDPFLFFSEWYRDAHEKNCADPHAFVLGTVSADGQPSSRIVYMRELLEEGIVLYTNYLSRKGEQTDLNPKVSALFYWDCLERQVRMEGMIEKVDPALSDDYFASRPRMSQIGAWASEQSKEIPDRATLDERVTYFEEKFPGVVPRPPHWGGYLIRPHYFEFWQGRLGRLHDRFCYEKIADGWRIYRISP
ncbi:MAG: pyridoxamine 5'-phosphate oxidase [Bacteroidetes bacterium]|nr:pyridoxamine 5'-phosphate oxidase [Bacteroidota bacterium]